jgi:hypothetical protein
MRAGVLEDFGHEPKSVDFSLDIKIYIVFFLAS